MSHTFFQLTVQTQTRSYRVASPATFYVYELEIYRTIEGFCLGEITVAKVFSLLLLRNSVLSKWLKEYFRELHSVRKYGETQLIRLGIWICYSWWASQIYMEKVYRVSLMRKTPEIIMKFQRRSLIFITEAPLEFLNIFFSDTSAPHSSQARRNNLHRSRKWWVLPILPGSFTRFAFAGFLANYRWEKMSKKPFVLGKFFNEPANWKIELIEKSLEKTDWA